MRRGFTLLELLVVALVVAILAAIALANFQQATVRSRVTRVLADMATMRLAVEAYAVDHREYPRNTWGDPPYNDRYTGYGRTNDPIYGNLGPWISTPVAYMTRWDIPDPFMGGVDLRADGLLYTYGCRKTLGYLSRDWDAYPATTVDYIARTHGEYFMLSYGPDRFGGGAGMLFFLPYDPTNGTVSAGNIVTGQRR